MILLARLCSMMYNAWCRGKGDRIRHFDEFLPGKRKRARDWRVQKADFKIKARAHNAKWQSQSHH